MYMILGLSGALHAQQPTDLVTRANCAAVISNAASQINLIPASPAIAPDPVVVALQAASDGSGSTMYADLTGALAHGGKVLFVGYTCPRPALWAAQYSLPVREQGIRHSRGRVATHVYRGEPLQHRELAMPSGSAVGVTFQDSGYTWTLEWLAGQQYMCTSSAALP